MTFQIFQKQADFYLFADDTAVAVRARKMPELRNKLDSVLNMITEWFCVNRLSLTLAPAGVWANLEPAGGWFQPPPPWDLENYATHREAVNGVR